MKGKKTGGRKVGSRNIAVPEIQALARALTTGNPEYMKTLRARLTEGKCAPAVEAAWLAYAHGRPPETIRHEGADGGPLQVHHHFAP